MYTPSRPQLSTAFFGFVLIGVTSGAWGVLLPSLSAYYHVNKSMVGLLFFASATGYFLSALCAGFLTTKLGLRWYLVIGSTAFMLCCMFVVFKPPFVLILLVNLFQGIATAMIETGLNMFLASLPNSTALLNYLHAFYGAGALVGPLIASTILAFSWEWNTAFFIWTLLTLPLLIGLLALFRHPSSGATSEEQTGKSENGLLLVLKMPMLWSVTLFLFVYVGIEVSLGNWAYTFLLEDRQESALLAGWIVSGYWLGLTLGRFLLNRIAEQLHLGISKLMYICMGGIFLGILTIWLIPDVIVSAIAFCLVGTFLGPIYPCIVALLPTLVPSRMVPSAMGFLIGFSILGLALFPWLAGTLAQYIGIWSLLPYTIILTIIILGLWWTLRRGSQSPLPG